MMTAAQVDKVIDEVSSLVGGEDQGLVAFILRMKADRCENTDEFAHLAIKMLETTFGVSAA